MQMRKFMQLVKKRGNSKSRAAEKLDPKRRGTPREGNMKRTEIHILFGCFIWKLNWRNKVDGWRYLVLESSIIIKDRNDIRQSKCRWYKTRCCEGFTLIFIFEILEKCDLAPYLKNVIHSNSSHTCWFNHFPFAFLVFYRNFSAWHGLYVMSYIYTFCAKLEILNSIYN